ncbi:tRNA (34-2'-O)-methyltransferase regulator WDR6-like [Armigeres subalbatus]|uniref:tRNA (34-2'-O)-methyltransferase regulator WDR6-like n=1 Tax=Armigeres subalbatus TaxID=124917 RepID=UPI002ED0C77E
MQVQTDAICVRVLTFDKLLLAVGNQLFFLHVDVDGSTQRQPVRCLPPNLKDKIHGIDFRKLTSGGWLIMLRSGREVYSLVLGQYNTFSQMKQVQLYNRIENVLYLPESRTLLTYASRRLNDSISAVKFIGENEACLITAHGVAARLCQDYFGDWFVSEICCCEDGSTLYCSQIVGNDWASALCFSGTALGLLLAWRFGGPNKGQILCSVSAHRGVVFSIECDLERYFLTTTSDDRSVKFWKIQNVGPGLELSEMSYCFGHTARVFQSRIIRENDLNWVVSIGEDSNLCLWDESGNLVHKQRMEDGATLWNLDYDQMTKTIFICASNGNVSKLGIEKFLKSNQDRMVVRDVTPDLDGDHPTKVKLYSDGSIIAVTNSNRVLAIRDSQKLEMIDHLEDQLKCSILEVSNGRIYVAGDGWIRMYIDLRFSPPSPKSRKLTNFVEKSASNYLSKQLQLDFNRPELALEEDHIQFSIVRSLHIFSSNFGLVICDNNGRCLVYDQDVETLKSCHRIPKTNERWLTSAYYLEPNLLLLADRSGNLYLFDVQQVDPVFKLPFLHGKLGVTDIQLEEETPEGYFFATTGHDSTIKSIFLHRTERRLELFEARKTIINWTEKLCGVANRMRFVMGFNDSHFLVIQEDQQNVLLDVQCGGGHRCWDCVLSEDEAALRCCFVFIQHKRLKLVMANQLRFESSLNLLQVPRLSWHVKACNTVRILKHGRAVLFVSGGEDNVLRINTFCPNNKTLSEQPRKHLHCHISSIKTIQLVDHPFESEKVLIISAGGRAQLCITALDPAQPGRTKQELSYMLLSSDSERARWRSNRTASFDPETRFMCVVLHESHLFVGCSDGFLRQFAISRANHNYGVELLQEICYDQCILHITKLTLGSQTLIVTMATDGFICFWDPTSLTRPFYKLKHHDSGINSFDIRPFARAGQFLIGTGGDDQKVVVTKLHFTIAGNGTISVNPERTVVSSALHIGQVTGVKFVGDGTMWSAGVDQRIVLMDFSGWKQMIVLKQLQTCIADVKGLELIPESQCLFVYGCGFEFINLNV